MSTPKLRIAIIVMFLSSCSGKFDKISEDKFIGLWEVKGRSMFEGIQIRIEKNDEKLVGKIVKLNNHKFVKLFADTTDIWVSEVKRLSNFQFALTEKKIAKDLFSLYGLPTSQEFKAEFINDNTIGLGSESSNPQNSTIVYKRIE